MLYKPSNLPIVRTKIPLHTILRPTADETCASLEYSAITKFWFITVAALASPTTAESKISILYVVCIASTKTSIFVEPIWFDIFLN